MARIHSPLERAELALKIIPNEHASNLVSAISSTMRLHHAPTGKSNADAALEILAHNEVGVILSDHRMPGMTGIELLSQVKTQYPHIVRLVLSGDADVDTVTDALRLGAVYKFLTKPWNSAELGNILLGAFEKHESELTGESTGQALLATG